MVVYGVPEKKARKAVGELVRDFAARDHAVNYPHVPTVVKSLGLPLVGIYTPPDKIGRVRLMEALGKLPSDVTVGDHICKAQGVRRGRDRYRRSGSGGWR